MRWRIPLVSLALAAIIASPGVAQPAPPWAASLVIVPGVSVGRVSLGMTKAMVFNRLGIPSDMERRPTMSCSPDCEDLYWIYKHKETVLVVSWTVRPDVPEELAGVDYVYTNSAMATVGGLQVGIASVRHAVERYGWWNTRSGPWLAWTGTGMRLRFDGQDMLEAVAIFPREP